MSKVGMSIVFRSAYVRQFEPQILETLSIFGNFRPKPFMFRFKRTLRTLESFCWGNYMWFFWYLSKRLPWVHFCHKQMWRLEIDSCKYSYSTKCILYTPRNKNRVTCKLVVCLTYLKNRTLFCGYINRVICRAIEN